MHGRFKTVVLLLSVSWFFMGFQFFGFTSYPANHSPQKNDPGFKNYIDSLIANAPLRDKIAQLFIVQAEGRFVTVDDRRFNEIKNLITDYHIGGLIFMKGDVYGQAILTKKFQAISQIPLWITQDMEWGAAMRVEGTTRFTPAMGLAATGNPDNAFLMGQITAKEAKALGVHQIFAPVLDVNNNPANPVINVRSFSTDPKLVAEYGSAFIQGVQSQRVVATAKHFPGHGDTDTDSHSSLPVVNSDYSRLDSVELLPFKVAIGDGINSIMSAHISFPEISPEKNLPVTLDPSVLKNILIDSLNFEGLVITDAMEMRGITSVFSPGRAAIKALNAGCDLILMSPDIYTAIAEVEDAVQKGEISEERINQSYRKILLWKETYGLFDGSNVVDIDKLDEEINTKTSRAIAERIARESITVLKNKQNILPINSAKYQNILLVSIANDRSGTTGAEFATELRKYHSNVSFMVFDQRTGSEEKEKILSKAKKSDLIIIGSYVNLRFRKSLQVSSSQHTLIRQLINTHKPTALVTFGNPYVLANLSDADVQIMAWYNSEFQEKAVASALFGASEISGKLPLQIPGLYTFGDGIHIPKTRMRYGEPEDVNMNSAALHKIDTILRDAVRDSVFPGAVAAVLKDGVLVYYEAFGYHDYDKLDAESTNDVFDLASITKIVSTTTAAMLLIDEGKLSLNDRVSRYIPEFNTSEKRNVTIGDLLLHQSGLPPFRVYVNKLKTREAIVDAIKHEPLIYEPGTQYVYSDLGMILLGEIIGQIVGERIDVFMKNEFYNPMGMASTTFNPKDRGRWFTGRIPPTEMDTVFDRGLVQAKVHDERAYFMDGVAGHAGLFSSATDLIQYCNMLLNDGMYKGKEFIRPETVRLFTSQQSEISGRGYGFDRKSREGFTSAGQLASSDTFGHTGFTGTSLWIDREKNMAVVLLTNRVNPYRSFGKKIGTIRAAVADAAYSSINK